MDHVPAYSGEHHRASLTGKRPSSVARLGKPSAHQSVAAFAGGRLARFRTKAVCAGEP